MGEIIKISGPVVFAKVEGNINDMVRVGKQKLLGEIIEIRKEIKIIQVYEDTTGLKPKEPVVNTNKPLVVTLAPGILGRVFDGTQRPIDEFVKDSIYIQKGIDKKPLDETKKWDFKPLVKEGDVVKEGQIIGEVKENSTVTHKILVPVGLNGKITNLKKGKFTIVEQIAKVDNKKVIMKQEWPVRKSRPYNSRLQLSKPLLSGQRVMDFFFPAAKGGSIAIPGPFGSGKTVIQHQFAKWCDADIIVYVGCGERGNEMTEMLEEFPHLKDPKNGEPLMNRTILIANTSNMPVAAREASVFTGVSIAEYFRDQGYSVALMADSTSRWAEAMREISGRLEEMPGEEGFPAYLSKRLSDFYERSGSIKTLGGFDASLTIMGAVSPPGGDFSEPVTQNTLRLVRVFWALDASLADKRHYFAINWLNSYSLYHDNLKDWFDNFDSTWNEKRKRAMKLLQEEKDLLEIAQLVGKDSLPLEKQIILFTTKIIREDFLQQNAYSDEDTYCDTNKTLFMITNILDFFDELKDKEVDLEKLRYSNVVSYLANMKNLSKQQIDKKEVQKFKKVLKDSIKDSLVEEVLI